MEITCDSCQSKFRIPDEKIDPEKGAAFKCPKCQNRITVKAGEDPGPASSAGFEEEAVDSQAAGEYDGAEENYSSSDKPFDFVEEEGKTALLCEQDPVVRKQIEAVLNILEYSITSPAGHRDALKQMRYHDYDVIVVNENFDTRNPDANGVLRYLERLHMSIRRRMFVAMLSRRFRTMDNMAAFQRSVNIIVNIGDMANFDKALRSGLADRDFSYRIFMEMLP